MINFEPLSKLFLLNKMRGFCENFRFSANLDLQKAKRKRSERSSIFCEAKRRIYIGMQILMIKLKFWKFYWRKRFKIIFLLLRYLTFLRIWGSFQNVLQPASILIENWSPCILSLTIFSRLCNGFTIFLNSINESIVNSVKGRKPCF